MRIASSDIAMASARTFMEKDEKTEELRVWLKQRNPLSGSSGIVRISERARDRVTLRGKAKSTLATRQAESKAKGIEHESDKADLLSGMDSKLYVIKSLIEHLTGKKVTILDPSELDQEPENHDLDPEESPSLGQSSTEEGWGIVYRSHESHHEFENTLFAARGIIKTKEGEEIRFSLYLQMNREFISEESTILRAGDAAKVDPLVLNFDGSAAELTSMKFAFDLDSDGTEEEISFVRPGSGFLALDINNDGKINNGSELFGPRSGNGLEELAAYDVDGNNWIDENDSIYDTLSVWTKSIEGKDQLNSLREKRIGAIYLSSIDSNFDIKDGANKLQGQINATGIYIEEDGDVKPIQQINMTV